VYRFEQIKQYATLAGDALRAAEERMEGQSFLSLGREIAYYHHEKWDGSGYPISRPSVQKISNPFIDNASPGDYTSPDCKTNS